MATTSGLTLTLFQRCLTPTLALTLKVVETPEHFPVCLIAQYHLMQEESARWANKTGGSVLEFHLYTYNATEIGAADTAVWEAVKPTVLEIYPEVAALKLLGLTVGTYDTMYLHTHMYTYTYIIYVISHTYIKE